MLERDMGESGANKKETENEGKLGEMHWKERLKKTDMKRRRKYKRRMRENGKRSNSKERDGGMGERDDKKKEKRKDEGEREKR